MALSRWLCVAALMGTGVLTIGVPAGAQSPPVVPLGTVGRDGPTSSAAPATAMPGASPSAASGDSEVLTITDGQGFASAIAYAVAVAPDGSAVMVGEHPGNDPQITDGAAAWHSTEGVTWTETILPKSGKARAYKVAASDRGWVAVGSSTSDGLIWTSTDGITWARAKPLKGAQLVTVIATDDGFLAGGYVTRKGKLRPTLWHSSDLTAWEPMQLPGKRSGYLIAIARNDAGVTMVLELLSPDGYTYLRSADGVTWEAIDFPAHAPDADHYVAAGQLGRGAGMFVQPTNVGATGMPTTGSLWTSIDGTAWQEAYTADGPLFAVASGAVVNVFGMGAQVTSTDGLHWHRTARPEIDNTLGAAVMPDGQTLVVSNTFAKPPALVLLQIPPGAGSSAEPSLPSAASSSPATTTPAATPAPSGGGGAINDALCDPILSSVQVESVTGQAVTREYGFPWEAEVSASCHYWVTDGTQYILSVEPGQYKIRADMADALFGGKKLKGLPGGMSETVDGQSVVLWALEGKNGPAYSIGGGTDVATLLALAKLVTAQVQPQ
ncbi:MAG: hypothetical protein LH650_16690 [Chloroflexi bacterium]|nr:hypothetical protein [Chloroflexota bacterium]